MITTLATVARSLSDLGDNVAHVFAVTGGRVIGVVYAPVRFALRFVVAHPRPAAAALVALVAVLVAACIVTGRRAGAPVGTYDRRDECRACGSHFADPHGVGCPLDDAADLDDTDDTADLGNVAEALADLAAGRRDQVAAMLAETPAPDLRAGRR